MANWWRRGPRYTQYQAALDLDWINKVYGDAPADLNLYHRVDDESDTLNRIHFWRAQRYFVALDRNTGRTGYEENRPDVPNSRVSDEIQTILRRALQDSRQRQAARDLGWEAGRFLFEENLPDVPSSRFSDESITLARLRSYQAGRYRAAHIATNQNHVRAFYEENLPDVPNSRVSNEIQTILLREADLQGRNRVARDLAWGRAGFEDAAALDDMVGRVSNEIASITRAREWRSARQQAAQRDLSWANQPTDELLPDVPNSRISNEAGTLMRIGLLLQQRRGTVQDRSWGRTGFEEFVPPDVYSNSRVSDEAATIRRIQRQRSSHLRVALDRNAGRTGFEDSSSATAPPVLLLLGVG